MGTWGTGNFDSDGAADTRDELINEFAKRIRETFESNSADLDEDGESVVMPLVAIILVVCRECNGVPPEPICVRRWRDQYLEIYDEQIENLDPSGSFKEERRQSISKTFSELESLSAEFWDQNR